MSKYDELRAEFIEKHKNADEFVMTTDFVPIKAVYLAPDPNIDYDELDALLKDINEGIE